MNQLTKEKQLAAQIQGISTRRLTWRHLRAMHALYVDGKTAAQFLDNAYLNHLFTVDKLFRYRSGNKKIIEASSRYSTFYERNHKDNYDRYSSFLIEAGLDSDARHRYTESDILTLCFIYENRNELKTKLTTVKVFSALLFHSSKYLDNHPGLLKPIHQLLGISQFPEQDPKNNQWRFVVDHLSPIAVILCENLNYLRQAWLAQKLNLELWYVGGNNIGIIDNIAAEKLQLPLYYSCDWDHAGLLIYSRVKNKIATKRRDITLLLPHDVSVAKPVDSPYHDSKWLHRVPLSGLEYHDYDEGQIKLISALMKKDQWIEEESQDLELLIQYNRITSK